VHTPIGCCCCCCFFFRLIEIQGNAGRVFKLG
jgi:hypothetical protein